MFVMMGGLWAFIISIVVIVIVILSPWKKDTSEEDIRAEFPTEETIAEEPAVSSGDAEEIVYDPPKYDFKLDEITVEIDGLDSEYTIAFVNDVHMITDHEAGDVLEENLPTVEDRYEKLSITEDGVHGEELWPEVIKFLNYNDFDAVVFAGDLLDYCSHSNMEKLKEGFQALKYPEDKIMYLRSDHDYGGWYGGSVFTDTDGFIAQSELWDGDDSNKMCIEFDDFMIVGVNKSYQNLSEDRLQFLTGKLGKQKPVIVATHVPFYSEVDDSLAELSMEVRNRIYYWNPENSSYAPDENTQKFIDEMYDSDSSVVQIVAAHLHAAWDGKVTENLPEHIFAPTFEGKIGIIHVVGTENKSRDEENG